MAQAICVSRTNVGQGVTNGGEESTKIAFTAAGVTKHVKALLRTGSSSKKTITNGRSLRSASQGRFMIRGCQKQSTASKSAIHSARTQKAASGTAPGAAGIG